MSHTHPRPVSRSFARFLAALLLAAAVPAAAFAAGETPIVVHTNCQPLALTENPPPVEPVGQPLCQPLETPFTRAGLGESVDTELVVRFVERWVPAYENGKWVWDKLIVRGFGLPIEPGQPVDPTVPSDRMQPITDYFDPATNLQWVLPGPSFRVRKGTSEANPDGSRLKILLSNYLPATSFDAGHGCNADFYCAGATYTDANGKEQQCSALHPEECDAHPPCKKTPVPQTAPDCFHGNNVTNLHYHGSHVSPQPHQDYVLLNLYPEGSTGVPTGQDVYAVGQYQTDIHPFPWNQAEGTHWYHPHKHGSTALQVLNGMSGAMIIEGPFDDWLEAFFCAQPGQDCTERPALEEKLLVVDQVWGIRPDALDEPELNLFNENTGFAPGHPLVNGQAVPVIQMQPGEVQRFRFIGATMQAAAHLAIGFEGEGAPQTRQIAQDGVQFSRRLYSEQPYRDAAGDFDNYSLAPGNRIDLLVKAPTEGKGCHDLTHRVIGALAEGLDVTDRVEERSAALAEVHATANPPLLTVCVTGAANPMEFPCAEGETSGCFCPEGAPCWYDEPYSTFLAPVETGAVRDVVFGMTGQIGFGSAGGTKPAEPNCFYLGNPDHPLAQYDPDCALETVELTASASGVSEAAGKGELWKVTNTCPGGGCPNHPFHIHINPFQLASMWGTLNGQVVSASGDPSAPRVFDPPIWQDTVALPAPACVDTNAGPIWNQDDAEAKCPGVCSGKTGDWSWNGQWTTTVQGEQSVCGCCQDGFVEIRQRYEDYTGAYVMHCHILGHEDRGMMQNVQAVCPGGSYGTPMASGLADDCAAPRQALPACENPPTCPVASVTVREEGEGEGE